MTNSNFVPVIDTQKLFTHSFNTSNRSTFPKDMDEGIYCLFHKNCKKMADLYVGSSFANFKNRAFRFFNTNNIDTNFYLQKLVHALPKEELIVKVKFYNFPDLETRVKTEQYYIDHLKPIMNRLRIVVYNFKECTKEFYKQKQAI